MPNLPQLNNAPGDATSLSTLNRCLLEGDSDAMVRARRGRWKVLGVSVAIESTLLVLLVAAPFFTGVAQPRLHSLLPPGPVFVGSWHQPKPIGQVEAPTTLHNQLVRESMWRPLRPILSVASNSDQRHTDSFDPGALPDWKFQARF